MRRRRRILRLVACVGMGGEGVALVPCFRESVAIVGLR